MKKLAWIALLLVTGLAIAYSPVSRLVHRHFHPEEAGCMGWVADGLEPSELGVPKSNL